MKKLFTLTAILLGLFLTNTVYCQDNYINPDGNTISLTILQNIELPNEKANTYDKPVALQWEFLLKYPTTEETTLLLYYQHSNNQIFSYDKDKYRFYNTNTIGVGATIYFK